MVVSLRGDSNEVRTRGQRNKKGVLAAEHQHRVFAAVASVPIHSSLGHLFAVEVDAGKQGVPAADRFVHALRAQGPPDATLATAEMKRVGDPPDAVCATTPVHIQVVRVVGVVSA